MNKNLFLLLILLCTIAVPSLAQSDDERQIEELTKKLYAAITFEEGGQPALDSLRTIFVDRGLMISNNGTQPGTFSVPEFIETVQGQIDNGLIKGFEERELSAKTEIFGKIAHRFSTYETIAEMPKGTSRSRGINSIQFIKITDRWFVTSLVWNDETKTLQIPKKYLPRE